MEGKYYKEFLNVISLNKKLLAILIDPDKFKISEIEVFLTKIPSHTTHLFVGGSSVAKGKTRNLVDALKNHTKMPLFLFPGDYLQIAPSADVLLFLTLLSGRNSEYLVGQQVKAISNLKDSNLEIIPTGYILIDGGNISSVSKVTQTNPLPQNNVQEIVDTALAGQYMGAKFIYLEAGSGAKFPVKSEIISKVKEAIGIPLIIGGGIKTESQQQEAYNAGADMIVMGTAFEKESTK